MNNQLKKLRLSLALFALPFVASASAQEWVAPAAPAITSAETQTYLEGTRSHSVTLNRVGQLEGRITSGDQTGELNVYFVRDGKVVTRTTTQDGGYFIAEGVNEGDYSFIATGKEGFVAYGVQVKPYDQVTGVNAIEAATVSAGYDGIQRILKNSVPSQIAAEISNVERREESAPAFAGSNVIKLDDGQLSGQVATFNQNRQPVYGTEVFVIQNDREIARTTADANGKFTVRGLKAGTYDFIAAGSNGIAAVRFQAVDTDSVLDGSNTPFQPVSFRKTAAASAAASLQVCLTCEADSGIVEEQIDYSANDAFIVDSVPYEPTAPIEYASESLGCGCAAGGSCGSCGSYSGAGAGLLGRGGSFGGGGGFGGGGFGGGGSFGRLIGLGGLAVGVVAIADDNDSTPLQASPSTN
ncbi:carboxypeptidase-like regulatory domain-containing protein [Mariniblastus sp.]|nr:carboxypeptidase-like regulatory domain-containing protein [Mariniblastus sp.]